MQLFRNFRPFLVLVLFLCGNSAAVLHADFSPTTNKEDPVEMDPFSVRALFPAIEVRFILLGENLADPVDDIIKSVHIANVVLRSAESAPEILRGDIPEAINGEPIVGKTLTTVAALLTHARSQGIPKWRLKRGWRTIEVPFDGDWLVPLPGLKR